jgi:hypothetical protein
MNDAPMRPTILLVACLTAGCYNYAPLTSPDPAPGTYLAVRLTDPGSDALARYLGPDAFIIRGRYAGTTERGLLLSVSSVEVRQGWDQPWTGETVAIPTDAIASLEVRRLARGRSYLLAGAGVAGVVALGTLALTGSGSAPGPATGGPPRK